MKVYRNTEDLPGFGRAVLTIGTFDGVHTGHQQIIDQLKSEASSCGGESIIVTFDPHPRKVIGTSKKEIKLINTLDEKIELLQLEGIDHLVIVPFTLAFAQLSAEEYIRDFLISKFHPHTIIIGYDHRFGKARQGDFTLMEEFSEVFRYRLCEIPVHLIDAISVSSTRIRDAIDQADIATANELLGYPFFFEGTVITGNKMGRKLGYPTANLIIENEEKLIPGNGVYAVQVQIKEDRTQPWPTHPALTNPLRPPDSSLPGMMNIGFRPTLDGSSRQIEVNIFDFDKDIYRQTLRVYVRKHLRREEKFSGLDALKEQLGKDSREARTFLAG
ncbi:MAG: bifunctional riboflavin kinase/FAD synthetase [Chitinophagales bacterium]